jgi:hypothetical protein
MPPNTEVMNLQEEKTKEIARLFNEQKKHMDKIYALSKKGPGKRQSTQLKRVGELMGHCMAVRSLEIQKIIVTQKPLPSV